MTSVERIQLGFICNQVEIQSRRPWKDVIQESVEKIKGYCTDQSNSNHENNYNSILSPNEDVDNGKIFDIKSGKTIRDLF